MRRFWLVCLLMAGLWAKSQNLVSLHEIDSLIELEHSQNGQDKIETQIHLADVFVDLSFDDALSYLEKGESLARKYGLVQTEAEIVYKKAELYYMQNDIDLSEEYTRQALSLISDTNIIMRMSIYRDLAYLRLFFGNVDSAFYYYREAMELAEQVKDTIEQADMLNNMAYLYSQQGEPDTALAYFFEAKSLYSIMGDTLSVLQAENNIALMYYNSERYEEALDIYNRICPLLEEYDDMESLSSLYLNKGLVIDKIYPESDSLYIYLNKALECAYYVENDFVVAEALSELAKLHFEKGDFDKALEYYNSSLEISENKSDINGELTALNGIGEVCYQMGDYENAIEKMLRVKDMGNKYSINKFYPMAQRVLILSYAKLGWYDQLEEEMSDHELKYYTLLNEKNQMHSDSEEVGILREDNAELKDKVNRLKYAVAGLSTLLVVLAIYTIVSGRSRKEK